MSALGLVVRAPLFWAWFVGEIVRSSVQIVRDIVTPGLFTEPRVVRLSLRSTEDWQVTTIAVLITLTPGTLTLGVVDGHDGRRTLLVHSMYHRDTDHALEDLRDMEHRMLRGLSLRPQPEEADR